MLDDADSKAGEKLRTLALEFSTLILAKPAAFLEVARWLQALPRCRHAKSTRGATRYDIVAEDDEDDYARLFGPICRRLEDGWACATYSFPPRTDRFINFGLEDAKRLALLAALTFDKDFDGAGVGLGWSWEKPLDASAEFEGRSWAWTVHTGMPGSEVSLLALVEEATRILRIKESLLHAQASPQDSARAAKELDAQIQRESVARERQKSVAHSLSAIEEAALDASWDKGRCETVFEPFEQHDPRWYELHGARAALVGVGWQPEGSPGPAGAPPRTLNWYDRFRKRLLEYGPWLVEQRWTPLARVLLEHAPRLGLDLANLLDLTRPQNRSRARFLFALERFGVLVRNVDDAPFRVALGQELGARFAKDADSVSWYHYPFEMILDRATRLLEAQTTANSANLAQKPDREPPSRARPAAKRAAASYEWAIAQWPELEPKDGARNYQAVYQKLVRESCPAYQGARIPTFETWKRQVRAGLHAGE